MEANKMCDMVWERVTRVPEILSGEHWDEICLALSEIAEAAAADKADALLVQDQAWHEIEDKHLARIEELEAENKALWTALARGDDGTID